MIKRKTPLAMIAILIATTPAFSSEHKEKELGNFYINSYLNYLEHEGNTIEDLGTGINVGYQYNERVATYFGYRTHSGRDRGSFDSYVLGGEYYFDDFLLFVEASKFESFDTRYGMGAGHNYKLGENWSISSKLGANDDGKLFANLGIRYDFGKIKSNSEDKGRNKNLKVKEIVRYNIDVKFEHDSSVLSSGFDVQLQKLVDAMNKHLNVAVTIEGHTSIVGPAEYNQMLSEARAKAVRDKLINYFGIDSNRINYIGYGETKPLVKGGGLDAQKLNRRVVAEIKVLE